MMILVVLSIVKDQDSFIYEFNALMIVLTIALNINMTVFYCRHAGSPYKDDKMRKKVHEFAWVVAIWTVAFVVRLLFNATGQDMIIKISEG